MLVCKICQILINYICHVYISLYKVVFNSLFVFSFKTVSFKWSTFQMFQKITFLGCLYSLFKYTFLYFIYIFILIKLYFINIIIIFLWKNELVGPFCTVYEIALTLLTLLVYIWLVLVLSRDKNLCIFLFYLLYSLQNYYFKITDRREIEGTWGTG